MYRDAIYTLAKKISGGAGQFSIMKDRSRFDLGIQLPHNCIEDDGRCNPCGYGDRMSE